MNKQNEMTEFIKCYPIELSEQVLQSSTYTHHKSVILHNIAFENLAISFEQWFNVLGDCFFGYFPNEYFKRATRTESRHHRSCQTNTLNQLPLISRRQ